MPKWSIFLKSALQVAFFLKMTSNQAAMEDTVLNGRRQLRFGTLNLNDRSHNARSFAEFILEKNLDIICFNECGEHLTDRLSTLLKAHGYQHCFASASFAGNALFSRLPINNCTSKRLKASRGTETRSAAVAEMAINICPGITVDFAVAAVHLDHVDESERIDQFKSLTNFVSMS